jgi:hypothetical protein
MMGMNIPAVKLNQCVTREIAVTDSAQPEQACKMVETDVNGDTVVLKRVIRLKASSGLICRAWK